MNREIKFRGKSIATGEWVFGLLGYDSGEGYGRICGWRGEDGGEKYAEVEIDPKSVGQFTGWKDNNGEDIYEGDLISENGSKPYEVIWQSHAGVWVMQSLSKGRGYREMAYDYAQRDYKVIGKIYEHQELLQP